MKHGRHMVRPAKLLLLAFMLTGLTITGACSIIAPVQEVKVTVIDVTTGAPADNIRVFALEASNDECPEVDENFNPSTGDGLGRTDSEGSMTLRIVTYSTCTPGLVCVDPDCGPVDIVTGRDYCFVFEFGDTEETLRITSMAAGATVAGESFELRIESISQPE